MKGWFVFLFAGAAALCTPAMALEVGQGAPEFTAQRLDAAQPVHLAEQHGRVVLVDFWASWCGPCRQSLPVYQKLRDSLGGRGFSLIAVNVDMRVRDGQRLLQSMQLDALMNAAVQDSDGKIATLFGVQAMPSSYLIDRHGVVRSMHIGFKPSDIDALRASISQLLDEK
jgi:thiol-disulfide isomerase/thioredoxin